jgi:hypothetical protein
MGRHEEKEVASESNATIEPRAFSWNLISPKKKKSSMFLGNSPVASLNRNTTALSNLFAAKYSQAEEAPMSSSQGRPKLPALIKRNVESRPASQSEQKSEVILILDSDDDEK